MTQNILVTGGAGYIGSHACKALSEAGFRPITLDNLCRGSRDFVKWGPLIQADIHQTDVVLDTLRAHDIAGVMHFAAFAQVGESVANPQKYYDNNVQGTLALLHAMRQTNIRKILFSSTCAVYGSPDSLPISEQTVPQPVNPYGRSKLVCEGILNDYAAYGFESIALRYFNAAGAAPGAGIGEQRETATRLIPRAVLAALGQINDFQVNGDDFPTRDGTAIRDYIHVSDLADAHVIAMRHLLNDLPGGCYNLGTGVGHSIKDVLDVIKDLMGLESPPMTIGPRREGDPVELFADASLAQDVLGFTPTRSDLKTIVRDTIDWFSSR